MPGRNSWLGNPVDSNYGPRAARAREASARAKRPPYDATICPHTIVWGKWRRGRPLLRSDPENPGPAEIAMSCKYLISYGRKGVAQTKIQRPMWRNAVLGYHER